MLRIKLGLLKYLIRKTLPVTLIATAVACVCLLVWPGIITPRNPVPLVFILAHCLALIIAMDRNSTGEREYLYTRGFSRDQIWGHTLLAYAFSILTLWSVATLIVWTPLRSAAQYPNPLFPIMAPNEHPTVWAWLLCYAISFSLVHYVSLRRKIPSGGQAGNVLFAFAMLMTITIAWIGPIEWPWYEQMALATGCGIPCIALIGAWQLHRQTEVQS